MLRSPDPSIFDFDFPRKMALKLDPFPAHEPSPKAPPNPTESGSCSPRQSPGALMDKSTLRVHLANGGFNVVKFGDATDIKVRTLDLTLKQLVANNMKSIQTSIYKSFS